MDPKYAYIGVFDSGLGGISVLSHLVKTLPHEDFYYFGDTKHNPYGSRTQAEIFELAEGIVRTMIEDQAKAIVIACNTATSAAADRLRELFPTTPILGIEPALKPACIDPACKNVLVMATPKTLSLKKFQTLAESLSSSYHTHVIPLACDELASCIEREDADSVQLKQLVHELLQPYAHKVDAVVLGCTHYPFVKHDILRELGPIPCFDGAEGLSAHVQDVLTQQDLLNPQTCAGTVTFSSSDTSAHTLDKYQHFFERACAEV